jgi:23S rRNA pseudouridine2605 synthase
VLTIPATILSRGGVRESDGFGNLANMTTDKPKQKLNQQSPEKPTPKPAPKPNPKIRLQRALATAGYGSRRQCEDLIVEGRVLVDGQIVTELGVTVDPSTQKIFVDGTPLRPRKLVYYALNKPTGVVTTNVDPEGRPRVIDLVPPDERVFPVGRLDRSSEGLILLTNDGELAQRLAHPKYEVKKVYRVTVAGKIALETLKQMERGIHIAEGLVRVEGARILKTRGRATELEITLKEGKNREIRRILARLGHKVQELKRIAIGPLRLGEMPTGAYRRLTLEEIKKLKVTVEPGHSEKAVAKKVAKASYGAGRPAKKKSLARKTTGDRPIGGKAARPKLDASRRPLPKKKDDLQLPVKRNVVGSIIGADPVPQSEDRSPMRKKAVRKKKGPTTRSFGRGGKKAKGFRGKRKDE